MHRGGKSEKKNGSAEHICGEVEEHGVPGVTKGTEGEEKEPSLSDLVAMLHVHIGQQDARDAKQNYVI